MSGRWAQYARSEGGGLPINIDLPASSDDDPDAFDTLHHLPAGRGVALFEDAKQRPIAMAVSANVRRLVRQRFAPPNETRPARRDIDWRAMTRTIRACACGSPFEADCLWLMLAQHRLPHAASAASDRWQAWFIHIDADAATPWFTKSLHPLAPPSPRSGTYLGPCPDKHAAGRAIDSLNAIFDLCRYRHLLQQTPQATACAYKEMGRCTAPCDGTIPLDAYRAQVRRAIDFASNGRDRWTAQQQADMAQHIKQLDFEQAAVVKRQLDDAQPLCAPRYRWLRNLDDFRLLSVQQSVRADHASIFIVYKGSVLPCADVPVKLSQNAACELLEAITITQSMLCDRTDNFSDEANQMLGLLCHHLFLPTRLQRGAFERIDDLNETSLRRLIRTASARWNKRDAADDEPTDREDGLFAEVIDNSA